MNKFKLVLLSALILTVSANASEGMIDVISSSGVKETADKLESILKSKGMTIFARVKHSESAEKVGIELRPTELIIFGNPKVGSLLMQCRQTVAIDLPQKALIWQDEEGVVRISYNKPKFLRHRHQFEGCDEVLGKIEKALAGITQAAAGLKQ